MGDTSDLLRPTQGTRTLGIRKRTVIPTASWERNSASTQEAAVLSPNSSPAPLFHLPLPRRRQVILLVG